MSIHEVLPATPTVVLAFVTYLFLRPTTLAYKSIKAYICHVKALAKTLAIDCAAFQCERVALALRTVRRLRGSKTRPKRLPITVALLAKFLLILRSRPRSVDISAIAAILAVGVFGLFRSGELVPKSRKDDVLLRRHILWEKDKVTVHLNGSKTDPFREGIDIVIFKNTSSPCPYSAFLEHWDMAPYKHVPECPSISAQQWFSGILSYSTRRDQNISRRGRSRRQHFFRTFDAYRGRHNPGIAGLPSAHYQGDRSMAIPVVSAIYENVVRNPPENRRQYEHSQFQNRQRSSELFRGNAPGASVRPISR